MTPVSRVLFLLIAAAALAACQRGTQAPPASAPPKAENAGPVRPPVSSATAAMPTLDVATVGGGRYRLADHRGSWVVVNFWATWCAPCLREMPELSALHALRSHVDVVGLAYEDITPAAMKDFLERHPVAYPIAIVDPLVPPKDFESPRGLPMTYLIAPDGRVARQFLGPIDARQLEDAIAAAGGPGQP